MHRNHGSDSPSPSPHPLCEKTVTGPAHTPRKGMTWWYDYQEAGTVGSSLRVCLLQHGTFQACYICTAVCITFPVLFMNSAVFNEAYQFHKVQLKIVLVKLSVTVYM